MRQSVRRIVRTSLTQALRVPGAQRAVSGVVDRVPGSAGDWARFAFYDWLLHAVPPDLQQDQARYWNTVGRVRWRNSATIDYTDLLDTLERERMDRDRSLVELGCGGGDVLRAIHTRLPALRLLGIDAASAMIERARGTEPAATYVCAYYGPPLELPWRPDIMVARSSLCCVPEASIRDVLRWIAENTSRLLIISEPVFEGVRTDYMGRLMEEVAPNVFRRAYDATHLRDYATYPELRHAFGSIVFQREAHSGHGQWVCTR